MNLKRRRSSEKHKLIKLTFVPFLSTSLETETEEAEKEAEEVVSGSCVTEGSSISSVVDCKMAKKKVVEKTMAKRGRPRKIVKRPRLDKTAQNATPQCLESAKRYLTITKMRSGKILSKKYTPPMKRKAIFNATRRWSNRGQNTSTTNVDPIVENVEASVPLVENVEAREKDHQVPHEDEKASDAVGAEAMEEKIMKLTLLMEEQGKTIKELLTEKQGSDRCFMAQNSCMTDAELEQNNYEYMHFRSQKKIAELKSENFELRHKLEIAHAKIEWYEKAQRLLSDTIGSFKDTYLISTLAKTTEMMLGLSSSRGLPDPAANPDA